MNIALLTLYTVSTIAVGSVVVKKWFSGLPVLLSIVAAFLLGTGVSIPITYFLTVLFSKTSEPILIGTIVFVVLAIIAYCLLSIKKFRKVRIGLNDLLLVIISVSFSTWLMSKTFHGRPDGQLFVGSNNVFDFGLAVGLMRSMSWGSNIPVMSPFFAGLPLFYHFFFNFWTALWEYFGVSTVWAINIPSILSFSAMFIVIYYLPQIIAKQKPFVGWIAVLLTITNSSLTFWQLFFQKGLTPQLIKDIWRLPTYPFAGPFDGSAISIFITLNNYVNQRHLAFATALGLFIFLAAARDIQRKTWSMHRSVVMGIMTGFLLLWNMVTYVLVAAVIGTLLIVGKRWKTLFAYGVVSGVVGLIFLLPIAGYLYKALFFLQMLTNAREGQPLPTWNIGEYLWQNLGLLPFIALFGYMNIEKRFRLVTVPFIVLFVGVCIWAGVGNRGFEQKSLSFLVIGINALAAVAIGWLWQRRQAVGKIAAGTLFLILTVSGFVDLMPIKNEFAYPLVGKDMIPVISWIHTSTPKNAVFVSYSDIIDPVVLAGRINYFGFFGNIGWYDRSPDVRKIYEGDMGFAKSKGVSYILVPRWQKSDFPYHVELNGIPSAYQDAHYTVYAVK